MEMTPELEPIIVSNLTILEEVDTTTIHYRVS